MMPANVEQLCQSLGQIAPLRLAESWDNVGLLVGDRKRECRRVMTCLTITPPVVAEAVERQVDLIVTHHPLPFKAVSRLTTDTTATAMLLELCANRVAVYSAHTAFDSASNGINQQLAEGLQLKDIRPLSEDESNPPDEGTGRMGVTETTLDQLALRATQLLNLESIRVVGASDARVSKVALGCGSGGTFLDLARRRGCNAMLTGEANFHSCLEAEATGIGLILVGHFGSERFAMEQLATELAQEHEDVEFWASLAESDPLRLFTP